MPVAVVQLKRRVAELGGVGTLALVVRLAHAWYVAKTPFFEGPVIDGAVNRGLAQQLAHTGDTGAAFYQPPLYPAFLSLLFRAGLGTAWSVALVQALLGAVTAMLLVEIGAQLASRRVGVVTGIAAALYGPFVLFDLELLPPCVVQPLLALALLLALRRAPLGWLDVVFGLAAGLAITGWPPCSILLVAFAMLRARRAPAVDKTFATLALVAALLPLGVTARYNASHGGPGVVVSYNLGINLWLGNNPRWRDTWRARPGAEFEPEIERPDRHGATTPAARSRFFVSRALADAKERPLAFVSRTAEKLYYVFAGREIRRDNDIQLLREASPVLRILLWEQGLLFPFGLVAPLALLGLWRRRERILACGVFGYALLLALFFVSSRYRLPLLLVLLPLAVEQAFELFRAPLGRPVYALAGLALLLNFPNRFTESFAATPAERGLLTASAWRNQGNFAEAERIADDLARRFPTDPNVLMLRAELLSSANRCDAAEPLLKRARVAAPRTTGPRLLLAECYEARGDLSGASRELSNALALHPYHPVALRRAGLLFSRQQRDREASVLASRFLAAGYTDPELESLARRSAP